ncbi:hypothetical protein, partial [Asanoa iriomotensis]|uniref:hypothetical protein n=1 Tax=Asanoa iriomotensis TaxID=234613 RepID=UPI00194516B1
AWRGSAARLGAARRRGLARLGGAAWRGSAAMWHRATGARASTTTPRARRRCDWDWPPEHGTRAARSDPRREVANR